LEEFVGVLGRLVCCFLPAKIWFNLFVPSENTEPRKVGAIMFIDMVGSSALAQRNEALALKGAISPLSSTRWDR